MNEVVAQALARAEGPQRERALQAYPQQMRDLLGGYYRLGGVFANPRVRTGYVWKYYVWHKWVLRQRHVRWFVERVYDGAWMQYARMVVGDQKAVWVWDGIECHPWW